MEKQLGEATKNNNIENFDAMAEQCQILVSERKEEAHTKESARTSQRRRKRQKITNQKGTDQTEARRLACDDPRTFITLDGCIQVCMHE